MSASALTLSLSPTVCSLNWSWESRTTSLTVAHTLGRQVSTAANTNICVCVWGGERENERESGRCEIGNWL